MMHIPQQDIEDWTKLILFIIAAAGALILLRM